MQTESYRFSVTRRYPDGQSVEVAAEEITLPTEQGKEVTDRFTAFTQLIRDELQTPAGLAGVDKGQRPS